MADTKSSSSLTNWAAFEKAGLFPIEVTCDGYLPVHTRNNGCHTRLVVRKRNDAGKPVDTAEGMLNHITAKHGSREYGTGFIVKFKQSEVKVWDGWRQLKEAKAEVQDFRCGHCGATVALRPGDILWHMKPHPGKMKKSVVQQRFEISLTIDTPTPEPSDDDLFEDIS